MRFRLWEVNGLFEETEVILEAKHVTRLQREKNITIGFICHDIALVQSVSHQVAVMYLGNLVEVLSGEDIAVKSVHPYTRARIGSIFDLHMDFSNPIESIESEIPSPLDVPPGCPFQNRCEHCTEICRRERPRLTELTPGHSVACHLFVPSGTENHEAHSPTGL